MTDDSQRGLDSKLTPDELEAFYEHSSARVTAIVLSAIVENHLTATLKALMRSDTRLIGDLFHPSGPLGPFGTKIRLAYLLRVVDESVYDDLIIMSKIRNKFAHDLSVKTFEGSPIKDWVKSMHLFATATEMEKTSALEAHNSNDMMTQAKAQIVKHSLLDIQGSFRFCLRLLIHHIVNTEDMLRTNEFFLTPFRPLKPDSE